MIKYKLLGKSAYFFQEKLLAIADLHLGYEDGLRNQGIMIPSSQFKETISDLDKIFFYLNENKLKVKEIVILGDLKHGFSGNSNQEWREVHELIGYLQEKIGKNGKILFVKGNHDNYLIDVLKNKAKIVDYYVKNYLAFAHGDKIFPELLDSKIKMIILGHKHPAITLEKSSKRERYKCFLLGKYKDQEILILPSFFPLIEGSDVQIYTENKQFSVSKNSKYKEEFSDDTNLAFNFDLKKFKIYIPVPGEVKVLEFKKLKS